jgi:hypothetical protein
MQLIKFDNSYHVSLIYVMFIRFSSLDFNLVWFGVSCVGLKVTLLLNQYSH